MEIFRNNKQNFNINNSSDNGNIKGIEIVKTYTYCIKCGKTFLSPSSDPWCDFSCRQEYYHEIAKEEIACYREFCGRD